MQENITALLVHAGESCFQTLELILEEQGLRTERARSCAEASASLAQEDSPQLVFTGTGLCDGSWVDVLDLASKRVHSSAEVIVVSGVLDRHLYLDAMEGGAFDFIVPPFHPEDLALVVRSAIWSARRKASPAHDSRRATPKRPAGTAGEPRSHDA